MYSARKRAAAPSTRPEAGAEMAPRARLGWVGGAPPHSRRSDASRAAQPRPRLAAPVPSAPRAGIWLEEPAHSPPAAPGVPAAQVTPPPPPPPRTKWTRRVPHPVLIEHAASLTTLLGGAELHSGGAVCSPAALVPLSSAFAPRRLRGSPVPESDAYQDTIYFRIE
jgi:hypothetical protein